MHCDGNMIRDTSHHSGKGDETACRHRGRAAHDWKTAMNPFADPLRGSIRSTRRVNLNLP